MPRHKLEFDPPETDYLLFGICSQSKDYRMVWILNKNFGLHLKRAEDIIPDESSHYSLFSFENKGTGLKYFFSSNKNNGNVLMKELKQMDYLLLMEGNYDSIEPDSFLSQLKSSESVLAAYKINPEKIKTKQHLILG